MKQRLRKINIAGTWTIQVDIELHGEDLVGINQFLVHACGECNKQVARLANQKKHKVNLKKVNSVVKSTR